MRWQNCFILLFSFSLQFVRVNVTRVEDGSLKLNAGQATVVHLDQPSFSSQQFHGQSVAVGGRETQICRDAHEGKGQVNLTPEQVTACMKLVARPYVYNASVTDNILNWEAPLAIQKRFPYYLSGWDKDGVPVWVWKLGRWDVRSFLEEFGNKFGDHDVIKYMEQMYERYSSPQLFSQSPDDPQDSFIAILDMDGFSMRQLSHVPSVQKILLGTRILASTMRRKNYNYKKGYIVNSNYVFQMLWTLMKPLLGRIVSGVELFGTDPRKFRPVLLREISRDQLPHSLGGYKDFVPVKFYG